MVVHNYNLSTWDPVEIGTPEAKAEEICVEIHIHVLSAYFVLPYLILQYQIWCYITPILKD